MCPITIRTFSPSDTPQLIRLFKEAVHAINIRHYSAEQVVAWADIDPSRWLNSLQKNITLVAECEGTVVGFTDMTHEGYLDRLYVHKDYQARMVGLTLFKAIEKAARNLKLTKITTNCSITAKLPAQRMGFVVVKEQVVTKNGVEFINYHMEKKLTT